MNNKTETLADRLRIANESLGETAKSFAEFYTGEQSFAGVYIVVVKPFHDVELSPRKVAFSAATAAAVVAKNHDAIELAMIDMLRKSLAKWDAELAAKGGRP